MWDAIVYTVYGILISTGIAALGLIGNTLAFHGFQNLPNKTVATFLFQALAIADNAVILTLYLERVLVKSVPDHVGYFLKPITDLAIQSSINITVLMSVTRLIAVLVPFQAKHLCTMKRVRYGLVLMLAIAVVYNSLHFVFCDRIMNRDYFNIIARFKTCSFVYIVILRLLFFFAIPLLLILIITIALIVKLKIRTNGISRNSQHNNTASLILITILVVFIICSLPFPVVVLLYHNGGFTSDTQISTVITIIIYMFHLINSSVNFLIYTAFSSQYRDIMHLKKCSCKRHHENDIELN